MRRAVCRAALIVGGLAAALLLTACGEAREASDHSADYSITVNLDEFAVIPEVDSINAGLVRFDVENAGGADHNFAVIRTSLPAGDLPLDGAQVDEDSRGADLVGRIRLIRPGESRSVTADLRPGRYVLICNLPGHYRLGMRATLEVK